MQACRLSGRLSFRAAVRPRSSWHACQWQADIDQHRHDRRSLHVGTVAAGNLDEALKRVPHTSLADDELALLLLVTPSYARAAKDGSLPVKFAKTAFGTLPKTLESVTAVVDSITSTRDGRPTEGIAYAACSRKSLPILLTSTQLRTAANKPGSLTFQFEAPKAQWDVQLPLSQTIFSTGLTATLIHRMHEQRAGQDQAQLVAERFLESLTFRVPSEKPVQIKVERLPLLPLTGCQIVQNVMGNIIRTVKPLGSDAAEEPASTGLEKAVTAYFAARDAAPEPVSVWALIVPKQIMGAKHLPELEAVLTSSDKLQDTWISSDEQKQRQQQYADLLVQLLRCGGRLVRVLSGGGGWGKKAGLLSLDPDLEYTTRELRDDFGWSFDFDSDEAGKTTEASLDHAIGKSVDVGDGCIFLKSHYSERMTFDGYAVSHVPNFEFGMCATDSIWSRADLDHERNIVSFFNTFKAFSRTGMAIKCRDASSHQNCSKLEAPHSSVTLSWT